MHFSKKALAALIGSVTSANCAILWDGRFDSSTMADLEAWSWSNAVGDYQNYIHGTSNFTNYITLGSSFKNPADSGSSLGAKITLDSTSYWQGQNMRRTELIPQTKAAIASGKVYYHFSMMHMEANAPSIYREHQICFFESHFTEMKSGWISGESGSSDPLLRWDVSGNSKWSTNWTAGVWHNVAYGIDFSAGSVEFYHSTGSDPLTLTVPAVSVSASSNGADWHLGVLELPVSGQADGTEDFYFSGVYIESGSLTTSVAGPGGAVVSSSSSASTLVESSSIALSSSVPGVEASSAVASSETSVQAISTQVSISSSTVLSVTQSSSVAIPAQQSSSVIASPSTTTKKPCTKKVSPGTTTTSIPQVSSPSSAPIIEFTSTKAITSIEIIPTTIYITAGGSTILSTSSVSKTYTSQSAIITHSSILPIAIPSTFLTSKKPCTKKPSPSSSSLSGNLNIASTLSSSSGILTPSPSSIPHTTLTTTITQTSSTTVSSSASATSTAGSGSAGTIAKYAQCGGLNWNGSGSCVDGCTCKVLNDYYSQCL